MNREEALRNIRSRETAEALHKTIGELLMDEVPKLPDDRSRETFWRLLRESIDKNSPIAPKATVVPQKIPSVSQSTDDLEDAYEINQEIQELAGVVRWPDAPDVAARAQDIVTSAYECGFVTEKQMQSLENMLHGMQKWVRD